MDELCISAEKKGSRFYFQRDSANEDIIALASQHSQSVFNWL